MDKLDLQIRPKILTKEEVTFIKSVEQIFRNQLESSGTLTQKHIDLFDRLGEIKADLFKIISKDSVYSDFLDDSPEVLDKLLGNASLSSIERRILSYHKNIKVYTFDKVVSVLEEETKMLDLESRENLTNDDIENKQMEVLSSVMGKIIESENGEMDFIGDVFTSIIKLMEEAKKNKN